MKKETKTKTVKVVESVTVTFEQKELDALLGLFKAVLKLFAICPIPMKITLIKGMDVIGDILDKQEEVNKPEELYTVSIFKPQKKEVEQAVGILKNYFKDFAPLHSPALVRAIIENNGRICVMNKKETADAIYKCLQNYGFKVRLEVKEQKGGTK